MRQSLDNIDAVFHLLEQKPRTLREIRELTGWTTCQALRALKDPRALGSVFPPIKDTRGRFHGGPVTYRLTSDFAVD